MKKVKYSFITALGDHGEIYCGKKKNYKKR